MAEAAIEAAAVVQPQYRELILGCGWRTPEKLLSVADHKQWANVTKLDIVPGDGIVVHDLNVHPLPFPDNTFDEIHAYDVLEHLGRQGDAVFFASEWNEYYRIAKHNCLFIGAVPARQSNWAWGDPGHTRIIEPECFVFLSQEQYRQQVGVTPMSDYRKPPWNYRGDWRQDFVRVENGKVIFALVANKE